ncbi:hypothetical protein, partial [Viscerimonas tarda]
AGYYLYDDNGAPESDLMDTPRGNSPTDNQYRFIFEETIDRVAQETTINLAATSTGEEILIGNPFMEHLDFNKFYAYGNNSSLIEDHYRLMDQHGNYATYSISSTSTGTPPLTRQIAPMQAVLVKPKTPFAAHALKTSLTMTQHHPGNNLRSAQAEEPATQFMRVSISDTKLRNRAALVYDEDAQASLAYNKDKDIYKMLKQGVQNGANVYFITQEGYYMDIKNLSNLEDASIKIGIATQQTGSLALGFEKLWDFAPEYDIYLTDKLLGKTVNLRQSSIYCFEKTTGESFIDDRFVLNFTRKGTAIKDLTGEKKAKLSYRTSHNQLEVFNLNGSLLDEVTVYDLQGRIAGKQQNAAQ